MFRYDAAPEFAGLVSGFWIPVWSVAGDAVAPQRVLPYPVCLLVIAADYARFYGVTSGMSTTPLSGDGWAVGVRCEPAAGFLLTRHPVEKYTDTPVDLPDVLGVHAESLTSCVRAAMDPDPHSVEAHHAAMDLFSRALTRYLPVDEEGLLVNRIAVFVESHVDVMQVSQVCEEFGLSERTLQRLVRRRMGLTPKWLIQRRRLHDAVARLRQGTATLAAVAADLGYADEPHFNRDFLRVTGMTPGKFAASQRD